MRQLMNNVGRIGQDNLIAGIDPPYAVTGVIIAAGTEATTLKRGTVLARSEDGKVSALSGAGGEGESSAGSPAYILCDDTEVGTEDVGAVAYRAGCFNTKALVLPEDYELTEADRDALRKYGIILNDNMQP